MKTKIYIFLAFLFAGHLFAQPGGGGGLEIGNLYDGKLEKINIHTNTSLKIRNFVLDDEKASMETLPASLSLTLVKYQRSSSNQRMYIVYKGETMIIDFIGIIPENAGGAKDKIDSLVFQKGYFKYYRSMKKQDVKYLNQDEFKFLKSGLTLYNTKRLISTGYVEYKPKIDLSFLSNENLPASYFINRAAYFLSNDQTEPAFADIKTATEKNNNTENCEIMFLLSKAFTKTKQYENAVENISKAIENNCKSLVFFDYMTSKVENLRTRAELYIKLKQYNKALEDFNSICVVSKNKIATNVERANFKIKYLKDYQEAINDLKTTIDSIPNNHLSEHPQGHSDYCTTYFTLATAEYLNGDKKSAFRYWLRAEEFGYSQSSDNLPIIHFDSIISQNPIVPELYLARALAHFKRGPYLGCGENTKKCFNDALIDINKAEELGMKEYRINKYRASVLNQLKRYDEAIKEIDIAISKNKTDPRNFLIRYNIRDKLGQVKWGDENDVDYDQYKTLSQEWQWEKY